MMYGAAVERFVFAVQVADTRYVPGVRPVNVQVAKLLPVPVAVMKVKSLPKPCPDIDVQGAPTGVVAKPLSPSSMMSTPVCTTFTEPVTLKVNGFRKLSPFVNDTWPLKVPDAVAVRVTVKV